MIPFKYTHRIVVGLMALVGVPMLYHLVQALLKGIVPVTTILQVLLWGFLVWKMCSRPRAWGIGVGLYLMVLPIVHVAMMVAFADDLARRFPNYEPHWVATLLWELLIFLAGVGSMLLRLGYPDASKPASMGNVSEAGPG